MSDLSFEVSSSEMMAGIQPAVESMLGQSDEYRAITPAIAKDFKDKGFSGSLFVPPVKFVVDATLGVMTQPTVEARLPAEVTDREHIAALCGGEIIESAMTNGTFRRFYTGNPDLREFAETADNSIMHPDNEGTLASLSLAPFYDSSVAAGGALRALRNEKLAGNDPANIIASSRGLLAISGIYMRDSDIAFDYLGAPYVLPERLKVIEGEETKVVFTGEALEVLEVFMGRGCPTRDMDSANVSDMSLLEESWRKIVKYLVPPHATVLEPQAPAYT